MEQLQQLMSMMNAGCSALSWKTQDGKHLWGRNMDFNRLAQGSKISFTPRGTSYYMRGTTMENNLREQERRTSAYAAVGTGFLMIPSTPVLYEGINEKGLMGGQLYYREFAHFEQQVREGTTALLPPFVVYHMLAQCDSVQQVVDTLQQQVTLSRCWEPFRRCIGHFPTAPARWRSLSRMWMVCTSTAAPSAS